MLGVVAVSLLALCVSAMPLEEWETIQRRTAPATGSPGYNAAYSFTIKEEGLCLNYCYPGGDKTIGYGHDCAANNNCAGVAVPMTTASAQALFASDLSSRLSSVCSLPNAASLSANQYAALVSFTFNAGFGNTEKYFLSYMQSKNFAGICSALPSTDTQGGSASLASRRAAEAKLCNTATSSQSGCSGGSNTGGGTSSKPVHNTSPTSAFTSMPASSTGTNYQYPSSIYNSASSVNTGYYGGSSYYQPSQYYTSPGGSYPTNSAYPSSGPYPSSGGSYPGGSYPGSGSGSGSGSGGYSGGSSGGSSGGYS